MNARTALLLLAGGPVLAATLAPAPVPASVKPCRDKAGRVIPCPTPRKVSPRCKDAAGRFVACPAKSSRPPDPT